MRDMATRSALLAIDHLFKKLPELFPRRKDWKADKELLRKILRKYFGYCHSNSAAQTVDDTETETEDSIVVDKMIL